MTRTRAEIEQEIQPLTVDGYNRAQLEYRLHDCNQQKEQLASEIADWNQKLARLEELEAAQKRAAETKLLKVGDLDRGAQLRHKHFPGVTYTLVGVEFVEGQSRPNAVFVLNGASSVSFQMGMSVKTAEWVEQNMELVS